jgi:hypothetical protein
MRIDKNTPEASQWLSQEPPRGLRRRVLEVGLPLTSHLSSGGSNPLFASSMLSIVKSTTIIAYNCHKVKFQTIFLRNYLRISLTNARAKKVFLHLTSWNQRGYARFKPEQDLRLWHKLAAIWFMQVRLVT